MSTNIAVRLPYILVQTEGIGSTWYRTMPSGVKEIRREKTSFFSSVNYDTGDLIFSDEYFGRGLCAVNTSGVVRKDVGWWFDIIEIALAFPSPILLTGNVEGDGFFSLDGERIAKVGRTRSLDIRHLNPLTVVRGGNVWIRKSPSTWLSFDGKRMYEVNGAVINTAASVPQCVFAGHRSDIPILSPSGSFIASAGCEWDDCYGLGGFVDNDVCLVVYRVGTTYVSLVYKTDRHLPVWVFTTKGQVENAFSEGDVIYVAVLGEQCVISVWDINRGYLWSFVVSEDGVEKIRDDAMVRMSDLCRAHRKCGGSLARLHVPPDETSEEWLTLLVSEELLWATANLSVKMLPRKMRTLFPSWVDWEWIRQES